MFTSAILDSQCYKMSMTGESKVAQRIFPKKENYYQYRNTQIKIYQQKI